MRKEALKIRQDLLQKVYSRPLNDLWCDLFERLVRDETFRPVLADPKSWWGKLRTWTRARAEGVKKDFEQLGAVLSSGNLNTAGLTLFLASGRWAKLRDLCHPSRMERGEDRVVASRHPLTPPTGYWIAGSGR